MSGVRRDCLRSQICRELLRRIVEGKYPPGERLIELTIAREFDTSQGPVREAFRELEALHVVETETYRGTRVRQVTAEELIEVSEVRGVLEEMAAIRAAKVLQGQTEALQKETAALELAAENGDPEAYSRHNAEFHRVIVRAGGNRVLERVWESPMLEARTRIGLKAFHFDLKAIAATHQPIVDALHRGDGPLAGRLLREHAGIMLSDRSEPSSLPLTNP